MKPYYQDDAVTIYHGNCLEILPGLGRFDLILKDPPYGKVRGAFDDVWTNRGLLLRDAVAWRDVVFDAMKPNATLYWFAWPSLAGKIEALIAERLNTLAHIVWLKPTAFANKACPEDLRAPMPETERIIMAEHYGADNFALGESGYQRKCDELRGFVFEPIRAYLDGERIRAGVERSQIVKYFTDHGWPKYVTERHAFSVSQFEIPTKKNYERLRQCFCELNHGGEYLRREYEDLRREYEDLRREYEDLRREYEDLRRFFDLKTGDQKSEIWRFGSSGNRNGHPTEKPLDLIQFMVRISCRPGGTVCDPFAGSGTTGRAAKNLGRKAVLIEISEKYCEIAAKRMQQEVLPLFAEDKKPELTPYKMEFA